MRKLIFILTFLLSMGSAMAQKGMVKIEGFTEVVVDSLVDTNHPMLDPLLDEFYDAAIYYRVDYGKELANLESIKFIHADLSFLGEVVGNRQILLNSELVKYPNLARVIFFRQMGKLYGLKRSSYGRDFMGDAWEIGLRHEGIAAQVRSSPTQKRRFFEQLAKEKPLRKKL